MEERKYRPGVSPAPQAVAHPGSQKDKGCACGHASVDPLLVLPLTAGDPILVAAPEGMGGAPTVAPRQQLPCAAILEEELAGHTQLVDIGRDQLLV